MGKEGNGFGGKTLTDEDALVIGELFKTNNTYFI